MDVDPGRATTSPGAIPGRRTDAAACVEEEAAIRLAVATGKIVRLLRRRAPSEVGPGSMSALVTLARCGPMRLGDLALREGIAPPTITRMIAALEEGGSVVRHPDAHDRRAVLVSITEAGAGMVAQVQADRSIVLTARVRALSDADRAALVAALPALEALTADELR